MGEDIDVLYNYIHSGNPSRREWCDCEVRDKEMREGQDRMTGDYNEFWAKRDYLLDMQPMKAALLMAHGFNDWNVVPEHSIRIYEAALRKGIPTQLYMHQEGHGGPPPIEMMNRWFTYFLHGVDNGVLNDPPVKICREADKREEPTAYNAYPHEDSEAVVLAPMAGGHQTGKLAVESHSVLESPSTASSHSQGTETIVDNFSFTGKVLAQAAWTDHRLLYATETLQQPLHISGTPKIKIRVASNKPAANLSVWLVALPWEEGENVKITDNVITRGWADPQNTQSPSLSKPLVPGEFVELEFPLQPDDQVIAAGQQLALMIFSSDQEFTLHPPPGTELTVDLDATRLSLPVVGGSAAFNSAFTPPVSEANEATTN
jgi:X-Pro dipeptidyl-peptidase